MTDWTQEPWDPEPDPDPPDVGLVIPVPASDLDNLDEQRDEGFEDRE